MNDKLKPCPLCGDPYPRDAGHGVQCLGCGLWLGNGTRTMERGGYKAVWNQRAAVANEETRDGAVSSNRRMR